jgi:DNA-binding MarR family transcriptional regulator
MSGDVNEVADLGSALVRLAHLANHVFADVSRAHGLTPQQVQLLCRLTAEPVGMSELGAALHLEKSSLSGLVARVERRGLVTRVPDPHDRRACRIALTAEGRTAARRAHREIVARLEERAGNVSPAERRHLVGLATRLTDSDVERAERRAR